MSQTETTSQILEQLRKASDSLLMMSESDYPFETFLWKDAAPITPEKVVQQSEHPQDTPVEMLSVDDFFTVATTPQDWHSEQEKATVTKFQNLVQTIKSTLKNPQVYRVGHIEIDAYILGETPTGDLAGLSTKLIET
ncbi:nuclease inhibitor homolog (plasmid) [Nostoc sp. HK-01]|uniref:nuclease A inhibitor family protein n=1 Tax=Nostocaceae TaxID=1162 RepID=UPI000DBB269A|nr:MULTISPECIES: nuclease A inhibitor family protein [Nostocaceae]MBD2457282.1 nuclease A inhibitor family protein [Nostoc sp. FACHB-87]MBD2478351.1 nuclease A inhibitor family protein [Anabaena sp. FACHB-83]BBD62992.1 nuclease inhibitor homolog [Nostoc sp. HK-01]